MNFFKEYDKITIFFGDAFNVSNITVRQDAFGVRKLGLCLLTQSKH